MSSAEQCASHGVPRRDCKGEKLHPTGMCILKMFSSLKTYCRVPSVNINYDFPARTAASFNFIHTVPGRDIYTGIFTNERNRIGIVIVKSVVKYNTEK